MTVTDTDTDDNVIPLPGFEADPAAIANAESLAAKLRRLYDVIRPLYDERDAVTAKINEVRQGAKAIGIPKSAFDRGLKLRMMEPEDRTADDLALTICRQVLGIEIDPGLAEKARTASLGDGGDLDEDGDDEGDGE